MALSVWGWSGLSRALRSLSVSSYSGTARSSCSGLHVGPGEVVHALECVEMFGAEPGLAQREQVLQERQGQIKPAGIFVGRGEVMHDLERAGVVGAEVGFHELER